ncbi:MAG: phosphotransferase, partial [Muribaculaceae bacterium]|nr:phosphotransferase [Muribaculaceae bacterium]
HNPGRYEPYKALTGRDMPVKNFLEDDGGIFVFLKHVMALVKESVECYVRRGFSSLSVNFGCTGGQHRSVYSAEYVSRKLHELYPGIRIVLSHREQGILEIMNPTDSE